MEDEHVEFGWMPTRQTHLVISTKKREEEEEEKIHERTRMSTTRIVDEFRLSDSF